MEYKGIEDIRLMSRMCAALAYLPINRVEGGCLLIMENLPGDEKLVLLMDYFCLLYTSRCV